MAHSVIIQRYGGAKRYEKLKMVFGGEWEDGGTELGCTFRQAEQLGLQICAATDIAGARLSLLTARLIYLCSI